ncbi:LysM peptidoglycan-binding domain-containing protein [Paraglaciecola sp.]|uniref:LysM peptidoglycan-binding domain-containing protein n=1 Tax=Paraglaciecola sp. TaxID=1920173 RepID=UPI0030F49A6E
MLRSLFFLSGLFLIIACTSQPPESSKSALVKDTTQTNKIALSHVRAYLLIGNIPKAEERFQSIKQPELNPDALLALAELRAAKGDGLGAQQAFLLSLAHPELSRYDVSTDLLDYFCREKRWQTLEGYATGLINSDIAVNTKNQQLSTIGLCFFREQSWQEAINWLSQLDFTQQLDPFTYLAMARLNIEVQQNGVAQQFIDKYETTKTQVDAQSLWTSFEVYRALQQHSLAEQAAQQLMVLFPNTNYGRKYLILTKRNKHVPDVVVKPSTILPVQDKKKPLTHLIKKGETLYQLSKRYNISVADLLKWNPTLVIDDISLGTPIQVSE